MSEVTTAQMVQEVKGVEGKPTTEGKMVTENGEHIFIPYSETASVSEGVSEFLEQLGEQMLEQPALDASRFEHVTQEKVELGEQIEQMLHDLDAPNGERGAPSEAQRDLPKGQRTQTGAPAQKQVYSSLFSLARSFNEKSRTREMPTSKRENHQAQFAQVGSNRHVDPQQVRAESKSYDQEKEQQQKDQEQEEENLQQQWQQKKKKKEGAVAPETPKVVPVAKPAPAKVKTPQVAAVGASRGSARTAPAHHGGGGADNVYIRFMALMARILGQAEYEAHQLYQKIKGRTDDIDALTKLISKINSADGKIDWSNDEEMKALVEKARAIGVDIPEGKYGWSQEEQRLLKENIQMRKDSMEKMTQLERTDMQRFLQEASQCHQARSNVLKLLKEVIDTIIHNMRV